MNQEEIVNILRQSGKTNDESITLALENLTTDFGSPIILMDLLAQKTDVSLQKAKLVYLSKSIKKQYKYLTEEAQAEINEHLLQILSEVEFAPDNYNLINEVTSYVYDHVPDQWGSLIELIMSQISSPEKHNFGLILLCGLMPYIKSDKAESMSEYLFEISLQTLEEENPESIVLGVNVFAYTCYLLNLTVDVATVASPHFEKLVEILSSPAAFTLTQFTSIWKSVDKIFSCNFLPEEIIAALVEQGLEYSSSEDADLNLKQQIMETIGIVIDSCEPFLERILEIAMDAIEESIASDGVLDDSQYTLFESVFVKFPHEGTYPLVAELVSQALESDSVPRQAAGLMLFRVLITCAPECIHKEIASTVGFLETAIASEEVPILQEAACRVLQYFSSSFKSLNCHSPQFITPLIQLVTSENTDLRTPAYAALIDIIKNLDTPVPDLFNTVAALLPEISNDNLTEYIDLIANCVSKTEEFDYEMSDAAIELIARVVESGNTPVIMQVFELALSIIKQDDAQIETINELLLGSIGQFVEMIPPPGQDLTPEQKLMTKELVPSIDYINGLVSVLKENAADIINDFIEPIRNTISQPPVESAYSIFRACLRCCAKIAKYSEEHREELMPLIIESIRASFHIEKPSLQKTAIECVLKVRNFIDDELRFEFFSNVASIIMNEIDTYLLIADAFKAAGKLIVMAEEQAENYMTIANEIVEAVANTTIPFLKEKPLIENGAKSMIFAPFCDFCQSLIEANSPVSDDICRFLLQWFEVDDELDHLSVSLPLLATVKSESVSPDVMQEVFSKITADIDGATDPNYQQNIAYFLNLVVQFHEDMTGAIIEVIPAIDAWYQNAISEKFGYQDLLANIASLYLSIAARVDSFDAQKINEAIEQFPPYDVSETATMVQNILVLNEKGVLSGDLAEAVALAIARFVVWDDSNIEKSNVPQEQSEALIEILKSVAANNSNIISTLERLYSKMRAKYRKISAVL